MKKAAPPIPAAMPFLRAYFRTIPCVQSLSGPSIIPKMKYVVKIQVPILAALRMIVYQRVVPIKLKAKTSLDCTRYSNYWMKETIAKRRRMIVESNIFMKLKRVCFFLTIYSPSRFSKVSISTSMLWPFTDAMSFNTKITRKNCLNKK